MAFYSGIMNRGKNLRVSNLLLVEHLFALISIADYSFEIMKVSKQNGSQVESYLESYYCTATNAGSLKRESNISSTKAKGM